MTALAAPPIGLHTEIIRGPRKQDHYTIIEDEILRDGRLSFAARGLLAFLFSCKGDLPRPADLIRHSPDGAASIRAALGELDALGYIQPKGGRS